jgi:hypothetical protein
VRNSQYNSTSWIFTQLPARINANSSELSITDPYGTVGLQIHRTWATSPAAPMLEVFEPWNNPCLNTRRSLAFPHPPRSSLGPGLLTTTRNQSVSACALRQFASEPGSRLQHRICASPDAKLPCDEPSPLQAVFEPRASIVRLPSKFIGACVKVRSDSLPPRPCWVWRKSPFHLRRSQRCRSTPIKAAAYVWIEWFDEIPCASLTLFVMAHSGPEHPQSFRMA